MPSSRPAGAKSSTDRLGVAGAAKHKHRGLLSPGQQIGHVLIQVAGPRVAAQSNDPQRHHVVQNSRGQRGKAVSMQVEVSQPREPVQRSRQNLDQ